MTVVLAYRLSPKLRNVRITFPCVSGVKYELRNAMQWRDFQGSYSVFQLVLLVSISMYTDAQENVLLKIPIHILNIQEIVTSLFCIPSSHPCSDQPSKRLKPSIWEDFDVPIEVC